MTSPLKLLTFKHTLTRSHLHTSKGVQNLQQRASAAPEGIVSSDRFLWRQRAPPPLQTHTRIHACTSPHLQSADLSVGPLQTEGHELSYRVFPQTVELRLLSAELDQHQRQLFRLHTATHTHRTEEQRWVRSRHNYSHPQQAPAELTGGGGWGSPSSRDPVS